MSVLIELKKATFGYGTKAVVRVDDLRLRRGRCLGIFGPNGAGKTTLVRGVVGLLPPLSGEVARGEGPTPFRIGYLPQFRGIDLTWPMSGFDAAALAASAGRRFGWVDRAGRELIRAALRRLDAEPLAGRAFAALSGGQQQRLLLAGALAAEPHLLVLDEPTDGLDVRSRLTLLNILRDLAADGLCIAIISHSVEDLLEICHDVAWLHPAETVGEPSRVEMIGPAELADRLVSVRRPAGLST